MQQRFVAIWFRHLTTDWFQKKQPALKDTVFVLAGPDHGRMLVTAASVAATRVGIGHGMVISDAKIQCPSVQVLDDVPGLAEKLLQNMAAWCIRFSPVVAVDLPDGLLIDATGCAHLWGGETGYVKELTAKFKGFGYHTRAAMADTIGAAWAVARYGSEQAIVRPAEQAEAIRSLPAAALRIDSTITERLQKLGLSTIGSFMQMPSAVLRRRFGTDFLFRLQQALGTREEFIESVLPVDGYSERLPCLELISTPGGIEIAAQQLLASLCKRLQQAGKGVRVLVLTAHRIDTKTESIGVTTHQASNNPFHLFKLLAYKIPTISPGLGIELFILEATQVEKVAPVQQTCWSANGVLESREIAALLDNLENRFGNDIVHRYLPVEHHWPERAARPASSLAEKPAIGWQPHKQRPLQLLPQPQPVWVMAPIPDYPPMNFRYQNQLYIIAQADACERIEAEWWVDGGLHRDYYIVEDEAGKRYWLYRLGHYNETTQPTWFLHGFFA